MSRRPRIVGIAALGGMALGPLACSSAEGPPPPPADDLAMAATLVDTDAPVLVKDPRTLVALEGRGLSFEDVFGVAGGSGKALLASPRYGVIVDTIEADLAELRDKDPVIEASEDDPPHPADYYDGSGVGLDFPHRQFDPAWLRSSVTRFELVGVVNRLDRKHVAACGEFRLIYRLAYTNTTGAKSASRLPMSVNVVFPQKDDGNGCATVAQRWLSARSGTPDDLLAGPLLDHEPMGSVEINFQAVRWPSEKRPDMGGHAEYVLRVFDVSGDTLTPKVLENTPRTDLGVADRAELGEWIRAPENLAAIDRGVALVPAKFLATRAISVAPRGIARTANRPFSQLFGDSAADFESAQTTRLGSFAALMRRLDTMTCNGCHQARAIEGFHLLGEDRDNRARLNALAIGRSPHFIGELPFRSAMLDAVAKGEAFTTPRPFAERSADGPGQLGDHCGLGDPGFASWTCASGLECLDTDGDVVGACSATDNPPGAACETGRVTHDPDPHLDEVVDVKSGRTSDDGEVFTFAPALACSPLPPGVFENTLVGCNPTANGFPRGMCLADCGEDELGKVSGTIICGGVPSGTGKFGGLNACLAGNAATFAECLASDYPPTLLPTCDPTRPCRDDYACVRVKDGPPGIGACMPPYFVFQGRVDGHIVDP